MSAGEGEDERLERAPAPLSFADEVFDVAFHPHEDVVAAGLVSGAIHLFTYDADEGNHPVLRVDYHEASVRSLSFSADGGGACGRASARSGVRVRPALRQGFRVRAQHSFPGRRITPSERSQQTRACTGRSAGRTQWP